MKRKNKRLVTAIFICVMLAAIVFARPDIAQKPIKFDHGLHVIENEMDCMACHTTINNLKAGERSIPDHDVCMDCHEAESDDDCAICHLNPDDPMPMPPYPREYLTFSHELHIQNQLNCAQCHSEVVSVSDSPIIPDMNDCMTCHAAGNAPLECNACHIGEVPKPEDHRFATWQQDHGIEASAGTADCSMCHSGQSQGLIGCEECHQGLNLFGSPHPPTWKFNHFAETSFGGECLVCHETRQSCVDCHKASLPIPHGLGPDWANKDTGGEHMEEAEAFMETCVSCHDVGNDEPTCAKCHNE